MTINFVPEVDNRQRYYDEMDAMIAMLKKACTESDALLVNFTVKERKIIDGTTRTSYKREVIR